MLSTTVQTYFFLGLTANQCQGKINGTLGLAALQIVN